MKGTKTIRILLVDDHPVVREGIRSCLAGQRHLKIVGEAADGREAIAKAEKLLPDVVLMDIHLPHVNGLEATLAIRQRVPQAKIIALTAHNSREYMQRIVADGACGYVLKDAAPHELLQAIDAACHGGSFFSSELTRGLLQDLVGHPCKAPGAAPSPLSKREREVLGCIADGRSNKEIADLLGVSVRTVETHRERLMAKLKIRSVAGLTKYAVTQGLTSLE